MKLTRFYYNFIYGFSSRKPKLLARIARSYLDILFGQRKPLRYLDLCVNLNCNLKCEHCFATAFKIPNDDVTSSFNKIIKPLPLSVNEWHEVVCQGMDLGAISVGFTGGEPLMYPHLKEAIHAVLPEKMLILVNTNGTLLTRSKAKDLYKSGVDIIQISLDSGIMEEHDRFRNQTGAFQRAIEGMNNALAAGLKVTIVPTISHLNIRSDGIKKLISYAMQKGVLLNLSMAAPAGKWNSNSTCLLSSDDSEYLNHLVSYYPHVRRDFETNYWFYGCGAAKEKLYITPYGDVIPCPYMHISFGNVRTSPLAAIRSRMLTVNELREYHTKCLVSEDRDFIEKRMSRIAQSQVIPVPWENIFSDMKEIAGKSLKEVLGGGERFLCQKDVSMK